jgi:hypothetical protein
LEGLILFPSKTNSFPTAVKYIFPKNTLKLVGEFVVTREVFVKLPSVF